MKKLGHLVFVIHTLNAQTYSLCDVNQDGVVNIGDVQKVIDQALGVSACTTGLSVDGKLCTALRRLTDGGKCEDHKRLYSAWIGGF